MSTISLEHAPASPVTSPRPAEPKRAAHNSADAWADQLVRVIRSRTGGRVRDLRIEVRGSRVLLQGQCATFYSKQLASHAAMPLIGTRELFNEIVVE